MDAALVVALAGVLAGCGGGFSSAPPSPSGETIRSYVALGDGFTAAPDGGGTAGDEGCQRSDTNYPAQLAEQLHVASFTDVSCVGATTASLTTTTRAASGGDTAPPQLDTVGHDTGLVTIGMGIEDRDLLSHVFEVCMAAPCGSKVQAQTVLDDIGAMGESLTAAVREVQDKASDAYIVLVGYPRISPDEASCDALPRLDPTALEVANRLLEEINREIRVAARATGAGFLDVARLSTGHELCSADPWVETTGARSAPLEVRPVAAEQTAVAKALAALARNH
ncbi:hypothetical protein ACVW00_003228 [Marmoricola sp. URHA0025 HA25]